MLFVVDDSGLARVDYAGIVHHDDELAKGFHSGFDCNFDLGFICDIAVDVEGVGGAEHGSAQCVTEVVLDVCNDYFGAMVDEEFCCAFTDPTCATGY